MREKKVWDTLVFSTICNLITVPASQYIFIMISKFVAFLMGRREFEASKVRGAGGPEIIP
jgi:hypothetical protein